MCDCHRSDPIPALVVPQIVRDYLAEVQADPAYQEWRAAVDEMMRAPLPPLDTSPIVYVTAEDPSPPAVPTMDQLHDWADRARENNRARELQVSQSVKDALTAVTAAVAVGPVGPWHTVYGLPVVVDDTLPRGAWRLVDEHGDVIRDFNPGERSTTVYTIDTTVDPSADEGDPQHCVVYGIVVRDQTAGDLGLCSS